jgi:hypothetical protein
MGILRGNAAPVVVVFSIIAFFSIRNHDTIPKWTPSSSSKAVLLQSDFIADFTHALVPSVIATHSNTERPPDGGFLVFTPFILRDGMLLCHRKFEIRFARQSTFIDMIRATLGSCGDDRNRTVMVHRPMPPPPGLPPIGEFVRILTSVGRSSRSVPPGREISGRAHTPDRRFWSPPRSPPRWHRVDPKTRSFTTVMSPKTRT